MAALCLAPGTAAAKAIDCTRTSLDNSAQAVCASASLRSLAAGIDKRYPRVAGNAGVRQNQREWISVRDRCNGNVACLTTAYRECSVYLAYSGDIDHPFRSTMITIPVMITLLPLS